MRASIGRRAITAAKAKKLIGQYRLLADQAKRNAAMSSDKDGREWFQSLAKTMTALADALERPNL